MDLAAPKFRRLPIPDFPRDPRAPRGSVYLRLGRAVLNGGKYVSCEPWFPLMELGVTTWDGDYDGYPGQWLRFCDRSGRPLPTGIERAETAEQAVKAAEQAV